MRKPWGFILAGVCPDTLASRQAPSVVCQPQAQAIVHQQLRFAAILIMTTGDVAWSG